MAIFRNVVGQNPLTNWWDNGSNQIAFGRGAQGFIAMNNDDWDMNMKLQTGLPPGIYCDVISGQKEGDRCTGLQVTVDSCGSAVFQISNTAEDPMVAIHVRDKL
ncbi:pancreatic alpha-amylase-like [Mobula birostris]|uniref:pancreatic alpha-amylase-like n=1 Tax=Mobula birostris TaxID=1983395 RepID=UPI003B281B05